MFTGIIEEVGSITALDTGAEGGAAGGRLRIEAGAILAKLAPGSSVAVNGCCLTVTEKTDAGFACDLSPETLMRTAFLRLRPGARVNLEAPLTLDKPLGGHIVQGHVDAIGTLVGLIPAGDENFWLDVDVPAALARYLVEKGSVAVEGISLTVAALQGTRLRVAVIPFTMEKTNLASLQPGDPLNLECDVVAKYVEKLLGDRAAPALVPSQPKEPAPNGASRLTRERLLDEGF
ncbi:MAG TPA: riboflavin synthase [Candidatus Xenobia bacterium]|nr:riboflavin synthase [Candidatus Xenobia bacterium]